MGTPLASARSSEILQRDFLEKHLYFHPRFKRELMMSELKQLANSAMGIILTSFLIM